MIKHDLTQKLKIAYRHQVRAHERFNKALGTKLRRKRCHTHPQHTEKGLIENQWLLLRNQFGPMGTEVPAQGLDEEIEIIWTSKCITEDRGWIFKLKKKNLLIYSGMIITWEWGRSVIKTEECCQVGTGWLKWKSLSHWAQDSWDLVMGTKTTRQKKLRDRTFKDSWESHHRVISLLLRVKVAFLRRNSAKLSEPNDWAGWAFQLQDKAASCTHEQWGMHIPVQPPGDGELNREWAHAEMLTEASAKVTQTLKIQTQWGKMSISRIAGLKSKATQQFHGLVTTYSNIWAYGDRSYSKWHVWIYNVFKSQTEVHL